jgi:toxin YoeB
MTRYKTIFTKLALEDVSALKRKDPRAYKKLEIFIHELQIHPSVGTGHPKMLSGDRAGQWSRRVTAKHRLVYVIEEEKAEVVICFQDLQTKKSGQPRPLSFFTLHQSSPRENAGLSSRPPGKK